MKKGLVILILLIIFFSLFANQNIHKQWTGQGEIIVSWCKQKTLPINITIHNDNRVTGKIGDAIIENGKIYRRNFIMRWFGNGEYIIKGKLKGNIVLKEQIYRKNFQLMFSIRNNKINGALHTSGSKFGGKNKMIFTVSKISLK